MLLLPSPALAQLEIAETPAPAPPTRTESPVQDRFTAATGAHVAIDTFHDPRIEFDGGEHGTLVLRDATMTGFGVGVGFTFSYGAWRILSLRGMLGALAWSGNARLYADSADRFSEAGAPVWLGIDVGTGVNIPVGPVVLFAEALFSYDGAITSGYVGEEAHPYSAELPIVRAVLGASFRPMDPIFIDVAVRLGVTLDEEPGFVHGVTVGCGVVGGP